MGTQSLHSCTVLSEGFQAHSTARAFSPADTTEVVLSLRPTVGLCTTCKGSLKSVVSHLTCMSTEWGTQSLH
mgnify:CR=1 FL=1